MTKTIHGMAETRFYRTWDNAKQRTTNPNYIGFKNYGGRGITLCERWQQFNGFKEDLLTSYEAHVKKHGERNTSIDRIDNDKGYYPENIRFTTPEKQARNQRMKKNNSSGYTGVYQNKPTKKWTARLSLDGKYKHFGSFEDKETAIKVRQAVEAFHYNTIQLNGNTREIDLLVSNFYAKQITDESGVSGGQISAASGE